MKVIIQKDRVVQVGDIVKLAGDRWYTDEHRFNRGDVMTIVENNAESDYYMDIFDGVITVEIAGVEFNPSDFE